MDETDYVWRPAFLDEVQMGDVVKTPGIPGEDARGPWTVTGTRYEPTRGMCSIIGLGPDDRPEGYIAEGYRPVLRREYATPAASVAPQAPPSVDLSAMWSGLATHLAQVHGRPDLIVGEVDKLVAVHDEQPHGTDEMPHTHDEAAIIPVAPQAPQEQGGEGLPRFKGTWTTATAQRLAAPDEKLELPALQGEALWNHLQDPVHAGGHEFGDCSLEEVLGAHGTLEDRHHHDHVHNEHVELPHVHQPPAADAATIQIEPVSASDATVVIPS